MQDQVVSPANSYNIRSIRWLYVVIGTVMMLCLGTLYGWSIFRAPFSHLYPDWTASNLALNFTISMVCYCTGGYLGGKLSARTSNTVTALASAVLLFAGFFGVSMMPVGNSAGSLVMLYLFYGVCSGFGTGLGYNAILTGVAGWFPDQAGFSTGVLLTGFGIGTMFIGQIANALIPVVGLLPLFRWFAIVLAAVLVLGSRFVHLPSREISLPDPPASAYEEDQQDYAPGEMLRRPSFWIFFAWNLCMCSAGLLVINSAASIASYYGAAAVLGLLVSVFNGLSRIPFGMLIDKIGRQKTMMVSNSILLLCGFCLTVGGFCHNSVIILVGMVIMGVCFGNSVTIGTMVIRQFYGSRHFAVNLAILNCCALPASFIGPLISSKLQEISGGDYTSTFFMVIVFAAADFIIGLFVRKP
jgi:OFA family oxalate/formate antiporter-like MFS transporter